MIDWPLITKSLLAFLIPSVILEFIRRQINHKGPKLVYYLSEITTHAIPPAPQPPNTATSPAPQITFLNSYVLTIRNNGNMTAHNIEISHPLWPHHFQVNPFVSHEIVNGPSGQRRWLKIPSLAPKEIVSISYLFGPVQNWADLLEYVRSDEGVATRINVNLNRVYPMWFNYMILGFCILGLVYLGVLIWWIYPPIAYFIEWLIKFPRR